MTLCNRVGAGHKGEGVSFRAQVLGGAIAIPGCRQSIVHANAPQVLGIGGPGGMCLSERGLNRKSGWVDRVVARASGLGQNAGRVTRSCRPDLRIDG